MLHEFLSIISANRNPATLWTMGGNLTVLVHLGLGAKAGSASFDTAALSAYLIPS
jgi:hypothetical protein